MQNESIPTKYESNKCYTANGYQYYTRNTFEKSNHDPIWLVTHETKSERRERLGTFSSQIEYLLARI